METYRKHCFFTMFLQVLIARPGRRQNGQLAHKVRKTLYFTVFFWPPWKSTRGNPNQKSQFCIVFYRFFLRRCSAVVLTSAAGRRNARGPIFFFLSFLKKKWSCHAFIPFGDGGFNRSAHSAGPTPKDGGLVPWLVVSVCCLLLAGRFLSVACCLYFVCCCDRCHRCT